MTMREQILQALVALLATDPFFPPAELDTPEPKDWRAAAPGLAAGLKDTCAVQPGAEPTVTRDGGAEDDYEINMQPVIAYAVQAVAKADRRARRDASVARVEALIAQDRTLGLDVQVYAAIEAATADDNVPVPGATACSVELITLSIDYTAASPAG